MDYKLIPDGFVYLGTRVVTMDDVNEGRYRILPNGYCAKLCIINVGNIVPIVDYYKLTEGQLEIISANGMELDGFAWFRVPRDGDIWLTPESLVCHEGYQTVNTDINGGRRPCLRLKNTKRFYVEKTSYGDYCVKDRLHTSAHFVLCYASTNLNLAEQIANNLNNTFNLDDPTSVMNILTNARKQLYNLAERTSCQPEREGAFGALNNVDKAIQDYKKRIER